MKNRMLDESFYRDNGGRISVEERRALLSAAQECLSCSRLAEQVNRLAGIVERIRLGNDELTKQNEALRQQISRGGR